LAGPAHEPVPEWPACRLRARCAPPAGGSWRCESFRPVRTAFSSLSLAVWMLAAGGCNGSFYFDPLPKRDAASDACPNAACGWDTESCDAGNCPLKCQEKTTCQGACGSFCSARCEEQSQCSLAAADNGDLLCQSKACCDFSLGDGGVVTCQVESTCRVQCPASCSLRCQSGATCTLQCGAAAAMTVVGSAGCP
jgi:hypothetical protein